MLVSCPGFCTIENLARLEADLGKLVISSSQARFADCLCLLGVGGVAEGFGSLLRTVLQSRGGTSCERIANVAAE